MGKKTQTATPTAQEQIDADVVIIGAGIAGGLMAWELAKAGKQVVMLDAGPLVDRVDAVNRFRASATKGADSPYVNAPYAPYPDDQTPWIFYGQDVPAQTPPTRQLNFQALYIRGVGGTSWHFTGHAERFYPSDFQMRKDYGVGADWPFTYDELEPWYSRAEFAWGVAGGPDTISPPRNTPYPMPPVPISWLDRQVKAAAESIGWGVGGYPHARNSVPGYDGRPQCCGNASCRFICPIGAKYDGSVHVFKAVDAGAKLMSERVVYAIDAKPGQPVSRVLYKTSKGVLGEARAKLFILAAHAVETPKLLQMSTLHDPAGVANSSGLVGRNLMCNVDIDTMGYAPTPTYPYRGPVSATGGVTGLRNGAFRKTQAAAATFIVNGGFNMTLGPMEEAQSAIQAGLLGKQLRDVVNHRTATQVHLSSSVEVLPNANNTVRPDWNRRDALGLPKPKVDFRIDDYTLRGWEAVRKRDHDILKAMNAQQITPALDAASIKPEVDYAIVGGTARMGSDPKNSVVDGYSRSHDHKNLFVIGTSNYPTITICSPSLTLAAMALRSVDRILRDKLV